MYYIVVIIHPCIIYTIMLDATCTLFTSCKIYIYLCTYKIDTNELRENIVRALHWFFNFDEEKHKPLEPRVKELTQAYHKQKIIYMHATIETETILARGIQHSQGYLNNHLAVVKVHLYMYRSKTSITHKQKGLAS